VNRIVKKTELPIFKFAGNQTVDFPDNVRLYMLAMSLAANYINVCDCGYGFESATATFSWYYCASGNVHCAAV
jgi:hypothetical protein